MEIVTIKLGGENVMNENNNTEIINNITVNKDLETMEWKNYRDIAYYSLFSPVELSAIRKYGCAIDKLILTNYLSFVSQFMHTFSLKHGKFHDVNEIVHDIINDYFDVIDDNLTEQQIKIKYDLSLGNFNKIWLDSLFVINLDYMQKQIRENVLDEKERCILLKIFHSIESCALELTDNYDEHRNLLSKYKDLLKKILLDVFGAPKSSDIIKKMFKFVTKRISLNDMLLSQGIISMVLGCNFGKEFIEQREKDHYRTGYFMCGNTQRRGPEIASQLSKYYILYFFRPEYLFSDEKPDPKTVEFYVALNSMLSETQKNNLKVILNVEERIDLKIYCDILNNLLEFDSINNDKDGGASENYLSPDESKIISDLVQKEIMLTAQQKEQLEEKLALLKKKKGMTLKQKNELKVLLLELAVQQDLRDKILSNKDSFCEKIVDHWKNQFKSNDDCYYDYLLHQDYGEGDLYNKLYQCVESTNFGEYKRTDFIFDETGKIIGARPNSSVNVFDFAIQQIKNNKWQLINALDDNMREKFLKRSYDDQKKMLVNQLCSSGKIRIDDGENICLSGEQLKSLVNPNFQQKENLAVRILSEATIPEYESKKKFIGQTLFDFKEICQTDDVVFNEDGTIYHVKQGKLADILKLDKKRKAEFAARNNSLANNYGKKVDIKFDVATQNEKSKEDQDSDKKAFDELTKTLDSKCNSIKNVCNMSQYKDEFLECYVDFYIEQGIDCDSWEKEMIDFALSKKTVQVAAHCQARLKFYENSNNLFPSNWPEDLLIWLKKNNASLYDRYKILKNQEGNYNRLKNVNRKILDHINKFSIETNGNKKSFEIALESYDSEVQRDSSNANEATENTNHDDKNNLDPETELSTDQSYKSIESLNNSNKKNVLSEMKASTEHSLERLLAYYEPLGKYTKWNNKQKADFLLFVKDLNDNEYAQRIYNSVDVPYKYWDPETKKSVILKLQLKWLFIGCLFLGLLIGSFFIPGLPAVFKIVTVEINVLGLPAFTGGCIIVGIGIKNKRDFDYPENKYLAEREEKKKLKLEKKKQSRVETVF